MIKGIAALLLAATLSACAGSATRTETSTVTGPDGRTATATNTVNCTRSAGMPLPSGCSAPNYYGGDIYYYGYPRAAKWRYYESWNNQYGPGGWSNTGGYYYNPATGRQERYMGNRLMPDGREEELDRLEFDREVEKELNKLETQFSRPAA